MSLSENIRIFRNKKNMTQEQLAAALKISPQAISKWETGVTCPDCSLLPSLSKVLAVSLDELFENDIVTPAYTGKKVYDTIADAPDGEHFKLARELAWNIHLGLCSRYWDDQPLYSRLYNAPELHNNSAFLIDDSGFTIISNGKEPIFMLVSKPDEGYGDFLNEFDDIQRLFATLASPNTTKAMIYLMRHMNHFTFESEFLARECDIPQDDIGRVIDDLIRLKVVTKKEATINNTHRVLYDSYPSHKFIGIFLLAKEINYSMAYCVTGDKRRKPLLNENDP